MWAKRSSANVEALNFSSVAAVVGIRPNASSWDDPLLVLGKHNLSSIVVPQSTTTKLTWTILPRAIFMGKLDDYSPSENPIHLVVTFTFASAVAAPIDYIFSTISVKVDPLRITDRIPSVPYRPSTQFNTTILEAPRRIRILQRCPHRQLNLLRWESPSTWPNGSVPAVGNTRILTLPSNISVLISGNSTVDSFSRLVIPSGTTLVLDDADISISIQYIIIEAGGALLVGSEDCPTSKNIVFVFDGPRPANPNLRDPLAENGILVKPGGILKLVGRSFLTWNRLAASAQVGDDRVVLQTPVDWLPGQAVVIMSSSQSDIHPRYDIVKISEISADRRIVAFTDTLRYWHHAGRQYQAEVGLLTRSLRILGTDNSERSNDEKYGGSISVYGTAVIIGVEFNRMGQNNLQFRYPVSMIGASSTSKVLASSFVDSFYGCVLLNGVSGSQISQNVAFNILGHCMHLWSGEETGNTVSDNLVAFVQPVGWFLNDSSIESFSTLSSSDSQVDPTDLVASGIVLTSRQNSVSGNVVRGAWAGYFAPQLSSPMPFNSSNALSAEIYNSLSFDANTAAGCTYGFYFGGHLISDSILSEYRFEFAELGELGTVRMTRSKSVLNQKTFSMFTAVLEIVQFEMIDTHEFGSMNGMMWLHDARVTALSDRPVALSTRRTSGLPVSTQIVSIVTNVTFDGYSSLNSMAAIVVSSVESTLPVPLALKGVSFSSSSTEALGLVALDPFDAFFDFDCSVSGFSALPCVIASDQQTWWRITANATSVPLWPGMVDHNATFGGLARIDMFSLGVIGDNSLPDSAAAVVTWRRSPLDTIVSGPAYANSRTGVVVGYSSTVWAYNFVVNSSSPLSWTVTVRVLEPGSTITIAMPYPSVSQVNITRSFSDNYFRGTFPAAASMADFMSKTTGTYFFNVPSAELFVKISYPTGSAPPVAFSRGGASVSRYQSNPFLVRVVVAL